MQTQFAWLIAPLAPSFFPESRSDAWRRRQRRSARCHSCNTPKLVAAHSTRLEASPPAGPQFDIVCEEISPFF